MPGSARLDQKRTDIEGHSTAAVCWDGAVVLADMLCLPPAVLLAQSVTFARSPATYAGWRWAEKTVVELGCGIAALPSLAAARNGARCVVCTDGNAEVLQLTRANAAQWAREQPGDRVTTPVTTMELGWGDGDDARQRLCAVGVEAPVDVLCVADCIYVLDNPGAWGKLLQTIEALSAPHTLIFVTYADRGHNRLWGRFLAQCVEPLFHVARVGSHLLHLCAQPGAKGRLEQRLPPVELYCWAKKGGEEPGPAAARAEDDTAAPQLSAPPSPPSSPPNVPSPSPPPPVEAPLRGDNPFGTSPPTACSTTPMPRLWDGLTPAAQRGIVQKAEQRLRDHNLEAYLAFGDGEDDAASAAPPTDAMRCPQTAWIVRGLLTRADCAHIRRAVDAAAAARGGWQTNRHWRYPTTDLPLSAAPSVEAWLRALVFEGVMRPLSRFYCGEAFLPEHLELHDCFFVKYAARPGQQRGLPMHTDGSLFSFNLLLSDPLEEFDGGGTAFQEAGWVVSGGLGDAVVHGGDVSHGGCPISRSERYLLVGFIQVVRGEAYCVTDSEGAARHAFTKFGHAAWEREVRGGLVRLDASSAEVSAMTDDAPKAEAATAAAEHQARATAEVVGVVDLVEVDAQAVQRRSAAGVLQAAHRGRLGRRLAELVADEAMIAEAVVELERAAEARQAEAPAHAAERAAAQERAASARSSLFSVAARREMRMMSWPEAAQLLLCSAFQPASQAWQSQHDERLVMVRSSQHAQATSSLGACSVFASHRAFKLPDAGASAAPTRPQLLGQRPAAATAAPLTTCVHQFGLHTHLRQSLLPALHAEALRQRRSDPDGVQVSNVGGWHAHEQAFETLAEGGGRGLWYAELLPLIQAAVALLDEGNGDGGGGGGGGGGDGGGGGGGSGGGSGGGDSMVCEPERLVSGWLNSSGPAAFNALHEHGYDVEWSLVLFVATGEGGGGGDRGGGDGGGGDGGGGDGGGGDGGVDGGAGDAASRGEELGGSLLLKTQQGPITRQRHGFLPVAPTPGELWAFPGYMPHCVMPRVLGVEERATAEEQATDEARQRVSVAFNVYSAAATAASGAGKG